MAGAVCMAVTSVGDVHTLPPYPILSRSSRYGRSPSANLGHSCVARTSRLTKRLARLRPDQLSGGENQRDRRSPCPQRSDRRVADEPTANLDSSHGREIARLPRRLAFGGRGTL